MTKPLKQASITSFFTKKTPAVAREHSQLLPSSSPVQLENCQNWNNNNNNDNGSLEFKSPAPVAISNKQQSTFNNRNATEMTDLSLAVELQDNSVEFVPISSKRPQSELSSTVAKRRQIIVSDDEEEDNKVTANHYQATPVAQRKNIVPLSNLSSSFTPVAKSTPSVTTRVFPETPLNTRYVPVPTPSAISTAEDRRRVRMEKFNHINEEKYAFLLDIRDAEGRKPTDPEYDKRTLYIPKSFWRTATPFEKQYWEIKRSHFDTVVFFKKGKFFELFERDADLGSRLFDLKLTDRGHMRMVGMPESSFSFWASKFIALGYKVAKVDQLETLLGKEMRERDASSVKKKNKSAAPSSSEDSIVRRELTAVLTGGTLIDGGFLSDDLGTYCMSVKERIETDIDSGELHITIGVCFIDTSTAEMFFCSFQDDSDRSILGTLLVQIQPKEIIFEKGRLSQKSMKTLKDCVPLNTVWNALKPNAEFWDSSTTWEEVRLAKYFKDENLPDSLLKIQNDNEAASAFGAIVWYLKSLKLDVQILTQCQFHAYDPIKSIGSLVLDGQTLINLEIFKTTDGEEEGSLFRLLDKASTPFGKRLLKRWMCYPLADIKDIEARLDSVDFLLTNRGIVDDIVESLSALPDLERSLSRIYAGNCKIKEFLATLDGLDSLHKLVLEFRPLISAAGGSNCRFGKLFDSLFDCNLTNATGAIKNCFDVATAKATGEFVIKDGVEQDYDTIVQEIEEIVSSFDNHLKEQKRALGCHDLKYKDLGKEIYQIEVPEKFVAKVPREWLKRSATKSVSRFHSPFLVNKTREYQEAMEKKSILLNELFLRVMKRMNKYSLVCRKAVSVCAEMDCLLSLARVSAMLSGLLGGDVCRPEFVDFDGNKQQNSMLKIRNLRHPCLVAHVAKDFVANDISLGKGSNDEDECSMVLLTGANMGGKSTLLRQACIAIIMAQLGCYVPASECKMTPFDRIFTRIGANDNIMAGQSTFMVELSETSRILHQATPRSLVILDELGRGTSTFDGYAIAFSVLAYLANKVRCLGLFSTHYGLLTSEYSSICCTPSIRLMHMQVLVDSQNARDVVFLYKLINGVSPKSYGMNVAHMAGIPDEVVQRAEDKAAEMVGTKGWIGGVGLGSDCKSATACLGSNLLLQQDMSTLISCSRFKKINHSTAGTLQRQQLIAVWKAAKARYL